MESSPERGISGRVTALAALFQAIAESADDTHWKPHWDSLSQLIGRKSGFRDSRHAPGVDELAALGKSPSDMRLAELLADAVLARTAESRAFRRKFTAWRSQPGIHALENSIAARPPKLGLESKPTDSDSWLTVRLPIVTSLMSVIASFLGAQWPLFRVVALGVLLFAGVAFWEALRRGGSWQRRSLIGPAAACTLALIALVFSYVLLKPGGSTSTSGSSLAHNTQALTKRPTPSPGSTITAIAPNAPARVEGVTPLSSYPHYNEATANKTPLTSQELSRLNNAFTSGSPVATQIFASLNAAQIGSGSTDVTVVGNQNSSVTINQVQVVKSCQAPLAGTLFYSPSQGQEPTLAIDFNLDNAAGSANVFQGSVVKLAPGETFTFSFSAATAKYYCQFHFVMTVTTSSGIIYETIDDNGQPFRLTAGLGHSRYHVVYLGGVASPAGNGNYVATVP